VTEFDVARASRTGQEADAWGAIPGFSLALAWLWTKIKLLIINNFLALAVALAFVDSKGFFGFGGAVRRR
jgi:hypothetical protein